MSESHVTAWSYADAPRPRRLGTGYAIVLHAALHMRRLADLRVLWPWLLVTVGVVLGGLGLVRLSLSDPTAWQTYVKTFALRAEALIAMGLATAAIRGDADAGALGAFLMRPRAPVALPLGRWLAVSVAVALAGLAMLGGLVATAAGTTMMVEGAALGRMTLAVVLDAFTYSAIFLCIACWLRSAAAVGLGWFAVADLVLPPLSGSVAYLSPAHHLGLLVDGAYPSVQGLAGMLSEIAKIPAQPTADPWNPWLVPVESGALLLLTAVPLVLAVVRLQREPPR